MTFAELDMMRQRNNLIYARGDISRDEWLAGNAEIVSLAQANGFNITLPFLPDTRKDPQ